MKSPLKPLFILVVLAAAGTAGWWYATGQGAPPEDPDTLTLYGNVDIREVHLAFRVPGRIESVEFEEGDRVTKGTRLATLEDTPYANKVAAARAKVEAAEAAFAKLKRGNRPQEIQQARARVREAQAAHENAKRHWERLRKLVSENVVAEQDYENALAQRDETRANLSSAREALELAQEGFRVEDVLQARAEQDAAEAELQTALTDQGDTRLYAPSAGIILTRAREPGAVVAAGTPIYVLSLHRPVWVRVYVPEPWLGRVRPGMPATVFTDTPGGKTYTGQVGFISPVAEFTPKTVQTPELRTDLVYRVRIVVPDPGSTLRQGMPVTVRLDISDEDGAPTPSQTGTTQ